MLECHDTHPSLLKLKTEYHHSLYRVIGKPFFSERTCDIPRKGFRTSYSTYLLEK